MYVIRSEVVTQFFIRPIDLRGQAAYGRGSVDVAARQLLMQEQALLVQLRLQLQAGIMAALMLHVLTSPLNTSHADEAMEF